MGTLDAQWAIMKLFQVYDRGHVRHPPTFAPPQKNPEKRPWGSTMSLLALQTNSKMCVHISVCDCDWSNALCSSSGRFQEWIKTPTATIYINYILSSWVRKLFVVFFQSRLAAPHFTESKCPFAHSNITVCHCSPKRSSAG